MDTYKDVEDSVSPRLLSYSKEDESREVFRQETMPYLSLPLPPATLFNLDTIDSKGHTTSVQLSSETHRSHGMRTRRGTKGGREEEGSAVIPFGCSAKLKIIHLISTRCFRLRAKH